MAAIRGDWTGAADAAGWRGWGARALLALGSYRLSVGCLVGLLLLTWLGTLHQVDNGLHGAQQAYFESFLVVQDPAVFWVGGRAPEWLQELPVGIPLPGGMALMLLLGINLLVGGGARLLAAIVRSRAGRWRRIGVLTTHVGIAILLVAGLVKQFTAVEGGVSLYERDVATAFHSFHDWELAVCRQVADGEVEEHRIPGDRFLDVDAAGAPRRFTSQHLPFAVVVTEGHRNAVVVRGPRGRVLQGQTRLSAEERNMAGVRLRLEGADGSVHPAILHGGDHLGMRVPDHVLGRADPGDLWVLELRKATHPLPFPIRLDRFEVAWHPGTRKARAFTSELTVWDPDSGARGRGVVLRMNEPLRAGDTVVYQSSWGPDGATPGERLFSGLQVVTNPTDSWPLYGCIVVTLGMVLAFGERLLKHLRRATARPLVPLLCAALLVGNATAQGGDDPPMRTAPWPTAAVDAFASVPVQHDGRVKPLLSRAGYVLLRIHGRRQVTVPDEPGFGAIRGSRLDPVEWALDTLFFPVQADRYPLFQVQSREVVEAIGLRIPGKKRRDRFSAEELRPGLQQLFTLAERYERIAERDRTGLQEQLVHLARNVADHERLVRSLDGARVWFTSDALQSPSRLSQVIIRWPELRAVAPKDPPVKRLLRSVRSLAEPAPLLRWLPAAEGGDGAWKGSTEAWQLPLQGRYGENVIEVLELQEQLLEARRDPDRFTELAIAHRDLLHRMAAGESQGVAAEVAYIRADHFYRALQAFAAGMVLVVLLWLRPRTRWLGWLCTGATAVGLLLLIQGIVIRCLLRGRPPITGLYDTILFITAVLVAGSLLMEWLQRRRIHLSVAAFLGFLGMLLQMRYEALDGRDTLPTLMAVLDTNFWLATHVVVINLGYAGALLAGCIAHVTIVGRLLGMHRKHPVRFRELGKATYGAVCFAALFTTVGTILGGIWANDSWGRFWGWDPKENGALMIVLWNLAILHARLGGMVRDPGIAVMAVVGNAVVIFSWFHTNLLGVGLHSYGFSGGMHAGIWSAYLLEGGVISAGLLMGLRQRRAERITEASIPESALVKP